MVFAIAGFQLLRYRALALALGLRFPRRRSSGIAGDWRGVPVGIRVRAEGGDGDDPTRLYTQVVAACTLDAQTIVLVRNGKPGRGVPAAPPDVRAAILPVIDLGCDAWELSASRPFDPSFLAGFAAERYSVELPAGFGIAGLRMRRILEKRIRRDMGGVRRRVLSLGTHHSSVTFTHVLLPVWIASVRYGDSTRRVVVNGRTGAVSGERPQSGTKLLLALVGILSAAMVLAALFAWAVGGALRGWAG